MLRRVDGKYVSKVDHRDFGLSTDSGPDVQQTAAVVGMQDFSPLSYPVLVIRGADSDVLQPDAAERFVAALSRGQLLTVANAGHNVHGANTIGFLDAVNPFLDSLP